MLRYSFALRILPALLFILSACQKPVVESSEKPIETIAFGSCNKQDLPQVIWPAIIQNNPQVWVWLGDNIYGDTYDMTVMQQKYNMVLNEPGYQQLKEKAAVIATWDDHDYGRNDAGKEYTMREESKQLFWDFVGEPANSMRRQQPGVYSSETYGPTDRQVKVIMLDTRYNRDELQRVNNVYQPNLTGDVLGEEQWQWLENELRNSEAQVHIIGSGIQFIPEEHRFEKWANFPAARQRLFDLIVASKAKGVILLSGDRHIAEISKIELQGLPYPLYEVTSSGMTHAYTQATEEANKYRIGDLVNTLNFGVLQFTWGKTLKVDMQVRGTENEVYLHETIVF